MADKSVTSVHSQPVQGKVLQNPSVPWTVVELTPEVQARTALPPQCHSALRAGFAGYSTNPRWNFAKLQAWRQGRQWREALAQGNMVVADSFLITQEDWMRLQEERLSQQDHGSPEASEDDCGEVGVWRSLLGWSRKTFALG